MLEHSDNNKHNHLLNQNQATDFQAGGLDI